MKIIVIKSKSIKKLRLISKLIMFFQKTDYSHMSIAYESETGNTKIADVTGEFGCADRTFDKWCKIHEIVDTKTLMIKAERKEFLKWFELYEGRKYDRSQVLGLLMRVLGLISFNKYGNSYKKMICNELILALLERFYNKRIDNPDYYDLNMTSRLLEEI